MIAPLIASDVDRAKKSAQIVDIANNNGLSTRTIHRYLTAYEAGGFSGLKPKPHKGGFSSRLPENYQEILEEAKQLKREQPLRSVEQIIYILEGEGKVAAGILHRSTLQKHLFDAGFGKKQMKKYTEGQKSTSTRRYCKPHRMMLAQADIKYGVGIIYSENGKKKTAYLSTVIDDHSRHILWSEWYADQEEYAVEDAFRKAILKAGKMDVIYCDNGKQYISKQLKRSCAMLGIRITHAKPYAGWSKGIVEKFHRVVDDFIAEVKLKKLKNLNEINQWWTYFRDEYYENRPHDGIREYYESHGVKIPEAGISPLQEWNRDSRPLVFLDVKAVSEAFLYHTTRVVDKGGCISFQGRKYEASDALIGATVELSYDPNDTSTLTVHYQKMEPFVIKPMVIGPFAAKTPEVPAAIQEKEPETSRLLDVIEKKYKDRQEKKADAISYGAFIKGDEEK